MTARELVSAIIKGNFDSDFDAIQYAIQERKSVLKVVKASELRATLSPGDTVYFNDKVRPAYLKGAKATVIRMARTKVVVDLDRMIGRFHRNISVPVSLIAESK